MATMLPNHDLLGVTSIDEPLTMSFEDVKKFSGMSKYRKSQYLAENKLAKHEEVMAALEVNKTQYKYITEFFVPNMRKTKKKYQQGLNMLFDAYKILSAAIYEQFGHLYFVGSSGLFKNDQIINGQANNPFNTVEVASPFKAWDITKVKEDMDYDLMPVDDIKTRIHKKVNFNVEKYRMKINRYKLADTSNQ